MQDVADGKYDEGVAHLERAYDILPHPNVLYNIGLAHMYAGRSEQALEYFQRYQETAPPSDSVEVDSLIRSLTAVKPAETESTEVAASGGTNLQSGGELSSSDVLIAVETAAQEIRRLAEEQQSDVLRKQADDLERAVARMKESKPAVSSAVPSPEAGTSSSSTKPDAVNVVATQTPPVGVAETARKDVYEEQVVSASRLAQSPLDAPNATAIITAQDIRMSGVTQLSQLLRRVAGVEANQVSPNHSEISIRGLNRRSANKVLILWDGRPIRKEYVGGAWWDSLPISVDDIERVEVIRGPASALYGADAFSGVINIITRAPGEGKNYAVVRSGTHRANGGGISLTGRDGKFSYRISGMHMRSDNAVDIVGDDRVDVRPFSDDPERAAMNSTASGEANYELAKDAKISTGGFVTYGDSTIQGLSRVGQINVQKGYDSQAFLSISHGSGLRLGSWFSQTYAYSAPSANTNTVSGTNSLTTRQADVDLSWTGQGDWLIPQNITVGANYRFKFITWNWADGDHRQNHIGAYLQDILQLAKPLRLQVGARLDRHPLLPDLQFSPRGSLVYRFLEEQSVRLSGGRAFRSPSFLESYLQSPNETPLSGVTGWGRGNPKLDPESITSLELGYQNQASDYFALEANVYYNWIKDAILITQLDRYTLRDYAGDEPLAGYNPVVSAYPVSALSYANERATYRQLGGELGLRLYPVEGLDLYVNYAIHDTAPTDKKNVAAERADEQQTSLHKINSGIQYRSWFGLEGSLDMSWFSNQLWIEQVTDIERGGVRWQPYRQPAFTMLSARLGYRLFGDDLELGVAATNLVANGKRQHPFGQPLDTRVLGTVKARF